MRRSARAAKQKAVVQQSEESEDHGSDEEASVASLEVDGFDEESLNGDDSSADEWKPEKDGKKGKRGRAIVEEESDDEEDEALPEVDDDEGDLEIAGTSNGASKKSKTPQRKRVKLNGSTSKSAKSTTSTKIRSQFNEVEDEEEIMAAHAALEAEEEADRLETEAAKVEAAQKWEEFRKRKESNEKAKAAVNGSDAAPKTGTSKAKKAAPESVSSWLGLPEQEWPTTCDDAMITDRDSLFVGYVYTLTTPSQSTITEMLSHLGKVVHPRTVPTDKLPPSMRHLPTNRRGAMHDIHAWRCLALKIGRTGLNGPDDYGLEEGAEDDGEKYGAQKITRAIKQLGATDVLVIVSRWYGGTLLGPVRFQHIENCARAALARYMINEALIPLKEQLKGLDEEMNALRFKLDPSIIITETRYDNLEYDKAERLITARRKGIEMLQKRLAAREAGEKTAEVPAAEVIPDVASKSVQPSMIDDHLAEENISLADKQGLFIVDEPPAKLEEEEDLGDLTGWDALAD